MSTGGYKIRNREGIHFVTFAVVEWVDVFTRKEYKDVLINSLKYCQREKGLVIYGWCLMSNHVHLIVATSENNTSEVLRDFKKFTAKAIIRAIQESYTESRKDWMLDLFSKAGGTNSRNKTFQFWRQDNHPVELYSAEFARQKLDYVHGNPVAAGIVDKAEEYVCSSARDYFTGKNVGLLEIEFLD